MKGKHSIKTQNPQRYCFIIFLAVLTLFLITADNESDEIQKLIYSGDSQKHMVFQRDELNKSENKPSEIFLPNYVPEQVTSLEEITKLQQNDNNIRMKSQFDMHTKYKFSQNLTSLIQEKLSTITQEDLDFFIRKGIIDETQALLMFELFIDKSHQQESYYTLQKDYYIYGIIPLVYTIHFSILILLFAISMAHKHFTLRISVHFFIFFNMIEIIFFYLFALYLQKQECIIFSTCVHIIFDLTIYNLLLDILSFLEFKAEDFEFNIYLEGKKDNLQGKIVFNVTLLAVSYISTIQFESAYVSFFFFWYLFYLIQRVATLFTQDIIDLFQPFPYFILNICSLTIFALTLLFEDKIFRPIFQIQLIEDINPDFSFMSYLGCLSVFQLVSQSYFFIQFFGLGSEVKTISHSQLLQMQKSFMISYYESNPLVNHESTGQTFQCTNPISWITHYFIYLLIIFAGFNKGAWLFIVVGIYGIFQVTSEYSKLYPNWFERKFILTSYFICLICGQLMQYSPDYLKYKLYPITPWSKYFFLFLHYLSKACAVILLLILAYIDQHTPNYPKKLKQTNETTDEKQQSSSQNSSKKKQQKKVGVKEEKALEQQNQGSQTEPNPFYSLVKTIELMIEILLGVYCLSTISIVLSEVESGPIFSFLQPLITASFILKSIYIFQYGALFDQNNENENSKCTFLGKTLTSKEKSYKMAVASLLFVVGFRLSLISKQVLPMFLLSGILMGMCIVYMFETDHLYKAEILVVVIYTFFTQACLLKANSYFFIGLITVITILNRFEKRYNKENRSKTLPIAFIFIIVLLFFYVKDNFSFSTFFYITEGVLEQIIPPHTQQWIKNYYSSNDIATEKQLLLDIIDQFKNWTQLVK